MEVFNGVGAIGRPLRNPVITIGNFDGVHRGHQALFQRVIERAREIGGQAVVVTFNPHPAEVLFPGQGPAFITSHEQKLRVFAQFDIDAAIVIPFDHALARLTAREFVVRLLVGKIGVKAIVVGYDYRFGRGREGDIEFLIQLGGELGFDVETVSGIRMDDVVVSSTVIRQMIQEGDIREANKLLGRTYEVCGSVIPGRGRGGRLLGFPTANVLMAHQACPRTGVYVVEAEVNGKRYGGAANIGFNPTFGDTGLCLEVNIFNFDQDIYGAPITVRFIDRLRDEERFSGPEALAAQIRKDVEKAREILAQTLPELSI
jgi:riboflavin kinase / FMN adenylyltransferase